MQYRVLKNNDYLVIRYLKWVTILHNRLETDDESSTAEVDYIHEALHVSNVWIYL